MATKQKTQIPQDPNDLVCDTCPTRFSFRGNLVRTDELARVAGWHIYRGWAYGADPGNTDATWISSFICPDCIGTNRTRIPAPRVLEGQSDLLADLGVPVVQEEQEEKKPKRKRREGS